MGSEREFIIFIHKYVLIMLFVTFIINEPKFDYNNYEMYKNLSIISPILFLMYSIISFGEIILFNFNKENCLHVGYNISAFLFVGNIFWFQIKNYYIYIAFFCLSLITSLFLHNKYILNIFKYVFIDSINNMLFIMSFLIINVGIGMYTIYLVISTIQDDYKYYMTIIFSLVLLLQYFSFIHTFLKYYEVKNNRTMNIIIMLPV
jgi:hypothetical protein